MLCILFQTQITWAVFVGCERERNAEVLCEIKFGAAKVIRLCDAKPLSHRQGSWGRTKTVLSALSSPAICMSPELRLRSNAPGLAQHAAPVWERIPEYQCCVHTLYSQSSWYEGRPNILHIWQDHPIWTTSYPILWEHLTILQGGGFVWICLIWLYIFNQISH